MAMITIEQARRLLPQLIATSIPGEEVLIVQDGQVVAKLVAVGPPTRSRTFASAKGSIRDMADDFDTPREDFKGYME